MKICATPGCTGTASSPKTMVCPRCRNPFPESQTFGADHLAVIQRDGYTVGLRNGAMHATPPKRGPSPDEHDAIVSELKSENAKLRREIARLNSDGRS